MSLSIPSMCQILRGQWTSLICIVVVFQSLSHFWLFDPVECSTPSFPVLHYLPELAQTPVHWVSDAIQPSHHLSPLLLLPSIFPSTRVFSNELALRICLAAAAAKSLQSCPTLCDPIDGSPPSSPVPGILQARTLEWVAISFSNAWKWKVKVKHSVVPDS